MPGAGIEPALPFENRFLRPARLPVPPPGPAKKQRESDYTHTEAVGGIIDQSPGGARKVLQLEIGDGVVG